MRALINKITDYMHLVFLDRENAYLKHYVKSFWFCLHLTKKSQNVSKVPTVPVSLL